MLWDGTGLVVKRVEALTAEGALRLVSAHPDYPPYERKRNEHPIFLTPSMRG